MPKGVNKDGSKKQRPANAGKKKKDGRKLGPQVLSHEAMEILDAQKNKAEYIEDAVVEKHKRDGALTNKQLPRTRRA